MSFALLVAAALVSADPAAVAAAAPAQAPAAAKAPAPAVADGNQVVCRSLKITGSRLGTRQKVCATKAEWAGRARDDQRDLESTVRESGKRPERPR